MAEMMLRKSETTKQLRILVFRNKEKKKDVKL